MHIQNGWTPLHIAAQGNKNDITELLIDNGANFEAQNKVSFCYCIQAVNYCLILLPFKDGQAAIHIACEKGNAEVVQVLIAKGAMRCIYDGVSYLRPA